MTKKTNAWEKGWDKIIEWTENAGDDERFPLNEMLESDDVGPVLTIFQAMKVDENQKESDRIFSERLNFTPKDEWKNIYSVDEEGNDLQIAAAITNWNDITPEEWKAVENVCKNAALKYGLKHDEIFQEELKFEVREGIKKKLNNSSISHLYSYAKILARCRCIDYIRPKGDPADGKNFKGRQKNYYDESGKEINPIENWIAGDLAPELISILKRLPSLISQDEFTMIYSLFIGITLGESAEVFDCVPATIKNRLLAAQRAVRKDPICSRLLEDYLARKKQESILNNKVSGRAVKASFFSNEEAEKENDVAMRYNQLIGKTKEEYERIKEDEKVMELLTQHTQVLQKKDLN